MKFGVFFSAQVGRDWKASTNMFLKCSVLLQDSHTAMEAKHHNTYLSHFKVWATWPSMCTYRIDENGTGMLVLLRTMSMVSLKNSSGWLFWSGGRLAVCSDDAWPSWTSPCHTFQNSKNPQPFSGNEEGNWVWLRNSHIFQERNWGTDLYFDRNCSAVESGNEQNNKKFVSTNIWCTPFTFLFPHPIWASPGQCCIWNHGPTD